MSNIILKMIILITILFYEIDAAYAFNYEKQEKNNHIVHVVTIDSKKYKAIFIKAHNEATVETVSSIAMQQQAEVAINGGFFDINSNGEYIPSFTLVIDGYPYGIKNYVQPLLVVDKGKISISSANPYDYQHSNISLVAGIPMLVKEGEICKEIARKHSEFYAYPHARTAIGIKENGDVVIVIAEHHYTKSLKDISAQEVYDLLKKKGKLFALEYHHETPEEITVGELKNILRKEYSVPQAQGLSMMELASIMKDLKCLQAINLDGGSSSALWINDKIVNRGDEKYSSPVSDIIMFKQY